MAMDLEAKTNEEQLKEQDMSRLKKKKFSMEIAMIAVLQCLKGCHEKEGVNLFSIVENKN